MRLIVCYLPTKSPWLNPIEPKWLAGRLDAVQGRIASAQHAFDEVLSLAEHVDNDEFSFGITPVTSVREVVEWTCEDDN